MEVLCTVYIQYDFPKQEVVIQFIIDAIQAEAFNPSTLFLIGTYTIGEFLGVLFLDNIISGHMSSICVFKGSQAI